MGFWDVTKRMLQGKPAFEVPPPDKIGGSRDGKGWGDTESKTSEPTDDPDRIHRNQRVDSRGYKVVPEAEITRVQPHYSGSHVELWVTIRNRAPFEVMLDKCYIFGVKQELDYLLQSGGEREFMVYRGERRKDDGYKYAELYYLDKASGDYFCAAHMLEYHLESDGAYDVVDMKLVRPVKDI